MIEVSVIVTTKNEEKHIENCLSSVKEQDFSEEDIEIIVVDNKSTDRTKEIALKYTTNVFDLGPERSAQRNFGIIKSLGKYVLYIDADMILSQNVVSKCFSYCEKEEFIALYIPENIVGNSFWIKARRFERSFYDATVIDCVRFVRKDKFLEVGGFDESLTGPEDWDFDRRIRARGKVGIVQSVINHDEGEFNFKGYFKKKNYYCKSFGNYIKKWGKDDSEVKKQLGFYYRFIQVYTENGKWKKVLMHPILTIGMFCLRFLVGVNYLVIKKGVNN